MHGKDVQKEAHFASGAGRSPHPAAKGAGAGHNKRRWGRMARPARRRRAGRIRNIFRLYVLYKTRPLCEKSGCGLCAEGGVLGQNKFCRQIALPFCRRCAIISKNSAALQGQGAEKIQPPADQAVQNAPASARLRKNRPQIKRCKMPPLPCVGAKTARKRKGRKRGL